MNIQNKPNIYTISNVPPPSYAEATGISEPRTYNNNTEFDQRCPRVVVCPSPSTLFPYPPNYYPNNNTPAQSPSLEYQQNESAIRQNEATSISYNSRLIIEPKPNKGRRVVAQICWMISLFTSAVIIFLLIFRLAK